MTKRTLIVVLAAGLAVAVAFSGLALGRSVGVRKSSVLHRSEEVRTVPTTIWFQGYLADSATGEPVNATYNVQASIYDSAVLGTQLWGPETHTSVTITEGWFNIELGSVIGGLPAFDDPPYYLELSVNGETLVPRLRLASVPTAFQASAADQSDDDWTIDGDDIYRVDGRVWVGWSTLREGLSERHEPRAGERVLARDHQSIKHCVFTAAEDIGSLAYLSPSYDYGPGLAAVEGDLVPSPVCDGAGYGYEVANCGVKGFAIGDLYGFGVAGYSAGYAGVLNGGVLGSDYYGTRWGALGFADAGGTTWGVFTPNDAFVGGTLRLPDGASDGYVLTSDASGNASWQQIEEGGLLPFDGTYSGADDAFVVRHGGSSNYEAAEFRIENTASAGYAVYASTNGTNCAFRGYQANATADGGGVADFDIGSGNNPSAVVDARTDGSGPAYYGETGGATAAEFYASSGTGDVVHAEYTGTGEVLAVGVYGEAVPEDYWGTGGLFQGGFIGCQGYVAPTGDETYYGVYGDVTGGGGSGTNIGVYGSAGGNGVNYAGYFDGDVNIGGTLTKSAGSFKIDHPLDPENKYLYHSFVESPDMKNVYDGVATLDGSGEAWVELPDWFEALNGDFRYQLTCIGVYAPVYVADEIAGNRFRIAGGEPGMKVSWQVTGIRHDKYAEEHRIPVEELKPPRERGKYIHPELYGAPRERSVSYDEHYERMNQFRLESRSQYGPRPEESQNVDDD